jgi:transcriptional regulator with XRE-family HTH domain
MSVGKFLRSLRHERERTLHQVSVKTDLDSPLLSKIERGERLPTKEQIKKLSKFYSIEKSLLETKCAAERILKDYGANEITYDAVVMVQEALQKYSVKQTDK